MSDDDGVDDGEVAAVLRETDEKIVRELIRWAEMSPNAEGKAYVRSTLLPAAKAMLARWQGSSAAPAARPDDAFTRIGSWVRGSHNDATLGQPMEPPASRPESAPGTPAPVCTCRHDSGAASDCARHSGTPAQREDRLRRFLQAIVEEHGANSHVWLTVEATHLLASLSAPLPPPRGEEKNLAEMVMNLREHAGQRGVAVAGPAIVPREWLHAAADAIESQQSRLADLTRENDARERVIENIVYALEGKPLPHADMAENSIVQRAVRGVESLTRQLQEAQRPSAGEIRELIQRLTQQSLAWRCAADTILPTNQEQMQEVSALLGKARDALEALLTAQPAPPSPSGWQPEVCICAAIQLDDGEIFRGHRHDDAIHTAAKASVEKERIYRAEQGFITSRNRFVGREEGARLQNAAGIRSADHGGTIGEMLFSEDLYLRSTKGQCLAPSPDPARTGGEP